MLTVVKLENKEQFLSLKNEDQLIIGCRNGEVDFQKVLSVSDDSSCVRIRNDKKETAYFQFDLFLSGGSIAKEVYLVKEVTL